MTLELKAQIRETLGRKVKSLRKEGIIPAVVYGPGHKPISIQIDYGEFGKVFEKAGESTLIKLKIQNPASPAGGPKSKEEIKNVLIHDIATDPVRDKFTHVDFYQVRMDKVTTAEVPLVFEGEAPAVKNLEGVLVKNITEIEVEALPANLPHEIKVDISNLNTFDDLIHIKDLRVPEGVKILANPGEIVVSVLPPRSEEELKVLEEKVGEKVEEVGVVGEEGKEKIPTPAESEVGGPTPPNIKSEDAGKK